MNPLVLKDVKNATSRLLSGEDRDRDVMLLARACQSIAKSLIGQHHSRHLRHFSLAEYNTESFAWRCVEDLFLTREGVRCRELQRYLAGIFPDMSAAEAEDVAVALRAVVSRKIAQTIPELYGELDQDFRKILRNVTRYVRYCAGFSLLQSVSGMHVSRVNAHAPLLHLPACPGDELLRLLCLRGRPGQSTTMLVDHVFDILADQSQFRRAIPLLALTALLRDFYALFKPDADLAADAFAFSMEREELRVRISSALHFVSTGLLARYLQRGALTSETADRFLELLRCVLDDVAEGENKPLFDYFKVQFPAHSYDEYRTHWRGKVEYLVSIAKERLL